MIIKIDKFGEGFCRGDRWCIEESELVDVEAIKRAFETWDEDEEECEEKLNRVEWDILYGDGGFCEDGVDKALDRLNDLLDGKVVVIDKEEERFALGLDNVEMGFMQWKIDVMKGIR
tara:strand:+ start:2816 stop:3166 length:351 start_codon:yes stop_codon:yes gene_type:complete